MESNATNGTRKGIPRSIAILGFCSILAGFWLAGLPGCGDGRDDFTKNQRALYAVESRWSAGIVHVCFTPDSMQRPDFATVSSNMHHWLNTTWAAAANINFTGFGNCGGPGPMVQVTLMDSGQSFASVGSPDPSGVAVMSILASADQGTVVHMFGHTLGFAHEMSRPDFSGDTSVSCQESDVITGGQTLGTPSDRNSIMAQGYCNGRTDLSPWDVIGVQRFYGRKFSQTVVGLENKCLEIPGGTFGDGITPVLDDCSSYSQRWQHGTDNSLTFYGSSFGGISGNSNTGECLDVPRLDNTSGNVPTLYHCNGQPNQQWALQNVSIMGPGRLCLERAGGSLDNGTPAQLGTCNFAGTNQTWTFTTLQQIRTGDGGPGSKCLDLQARNTTNGTPFTLYDCNGGPNQTFTIVGGGQLQVMGKCLDVLNGNPAAGTPAVIFDCNPDDPSGGQHWNTSGPLVSLGKCLDIPAFNAVNGVNPQIWDCNPLSTATNQRWEYYP
jgi:hypothetical protein